MKILCIIQKIYRGIMYRLMLLEYKRDVGRLSKREIDKKWPLVHERDKKLCDIIE